MNLKLLSISTIVCIVLIISCKKNSSTSTDDMPKTATGYSSHPIGSMEDMDEQLKWIAKGFATLTSLKSSIETSVHNTPSWQESISDLDASLTFASTITSNLDNIFPSNYYNPTFLNGIFLGGEDYVTYVEIPEEENMGHIAFLVVPNLSTFENSNITDEVYGYYMNGLTIDSILIDEDDFEQYYLWVIDMTVNDVGVSSIPNPGIGDDIEQHVKGDCNNNGTCDYPTEFADCKDCLLDTNLWSFKVKIRSIKFGTDVKPYHEKFLSGKYEFAANGFEHGPAAYTAQGNHTWPGVQPDHDVFASIQRGELCRETKRANQRGNNCPFGRKEPNVTLGIIDEDFNPYNKLYMIFYEWDFLSLYQQHYFPGTTISCFSRSNNSLLSMSVLDFHADPVQYVGNGEFELEIVLERTPK